MIACPSCDSECPGGARFCPACGAALAAPSPHAVERKIVTTMFCDLVDFTGLCEQADSEDVDRLLREFYALARNAIETFGGVVEKYVGDAVVGVFGVPASHEDDAERAVHTALRLRDRVSDLPQVAGWAPRVRIGINTGTAVVRHDVLPGSGEGFLVGDAVNTAARLEQLAAPMMIVVGAKTRELSARTIEYESLAPAALKGKRGAVKCWLVRGPVSRMGVDLRREFPATLVGREVEFGILKGLLKKVRTSSRPQFALVVGEPGIGKSRLLFELLRYVDSRPAIVRWRQGRCPAYGDGLTFWALGEIVKEQLGVLERDEVAAVEAKLEQALAGAEDREWLAARLRPLLGLESSGASREENFAAWQRFLELIAGDAPTVVVFEDLHWASEGTLAFLRHLVEHIGQVPLLAIGTTRPELFHARPDMAARLAEVASSQHGTRVELGPLLASETEELIIRASHGLGDLRETRQVIVQRAAGNPLFAEQLVRHLEEEEVESSTGARPTSDVALMETVAQALPESLQSLIAARLDDLPPDRKALMGDAAVVGEVFWTGAVAALDHGDCEAAEEGLDDLVRHDLVRRERVSSLAAESEFAFCHALIRDVAYAQLTRADRAAKHAAVARWLKATAGDRVDEVAEILAHHYATALELAKATEDAALTAELLDPTVEALKLAGDRALPLDVAAAERHYARTVELAGDGPRRPYLLVAWAEALRQSGRLEEAAATVDEGIEGLRALGDESAEKVASTRSRYVHRVLLSADGQTASEEEIARLANEDRHSPEHAAALVDCADQLGYGGQYSRALQLTDQALAIWEELGLPQSPMALDIKGYSRCALGDIGGLDDLRRAQELAHTRQDGHRFRVIMSDLGECLEIFEGPAAALRVHREALESAMLVHDEEAVYVCRTVLLGDQIRAGAWDAALAEADELERLLEKCGDLWDLVLVRSSHALLLTWRGDGAGAAKRAVWAEEQSHKTSVLAIRVVCLISRAAIEAGLGNDEACRRLLDACAFLLSGFEGADPSYVPHLPAAIRLAVGLGEPQLAERLAGGLPANRPFDSGARALLEALLCEQRGDCGGAAERFAVAEAQWARLGVPFERAQAALGRGRCLAALGKTAEARAPLDLARDVFAALGAQPARSEAESLLEALVD